MESGQGGWATPMRWVGVLLGSAFVLGFTTVAGAISAVGAIDVERWMAGTVPGSGWRLAWWGALTVAAVGILVLRSPHRAGGGAHGARPHQSEMNSAIVCATY